MTCAWLVTQLSNIILSSQHHLSFLLSAHHCLLDLISQTSKCSVPSESSGADSHPTNKCSCLAPHIASHHLVTNVVHTATIRISQSDSHFSVRKLKNTVCSLPTSTWPSNNALLSQEVEGASVIYAPDISLHKVEILCPIQATTGGSSIIEEPQGPKKQSQSKTTTVSWCPGTLIIHWTQTAMP